MELDKKSKRAIWLLSVTLLYLILGALVFGFFEYENDMELRQEIEKTRKLMQNKYNFTSRDFQALEEVVVKSIPFAAGPQWKFLGAFYFCTVVITTIGYGHSTPSTAPGKFFCIVFALIGIPLGLITFQSVGERINNLIKSCLSKIGQLLSKRGTKLLEEVKSRHLLFVSSTIGTLTIIIGTVVFHVREQWSLFDSYYYCVITLSTIGFGDFVALQTKDRLRTNICYWLFTLFFILFGLAIFSACVNLLILEFMAHNVTASTRLKRLLSMKRPTTSFRRASLRDTSSSKKKWIQQVKRSQSAMCLPVAKLPVTSIHQDKHKQENGFKRSMYGKEKVGNGTHPKQKSHFAVRRLPTRNVDHLVNHEQNHDPMINYIDLEKILDYTTARC